MLLGNISIAAQRAPTVLINWNSNFDIVFTGTANNVIPILEWVNCSRSSKCNPFVGVVKVTVADPVWRSWDEDGPTFCGNE